MLILDSAKAVEPSPVPRVISNPQESPVGYLQGQVFNNEEEAKAEDPIIIKCVPPRNTLPLQSERVPFPGFFCTNVPRTDIQMNPFFNNNTLESAFSGTFLDAIPTVVDEIDTNATHRSRVRMQSALTGGLFYREIEYRQIDLGLMRQVCARYGCRYLLIAWAIWPGGWTNSGDSYGTISIQRGRYLQDTGGYIPFDAAEHSQPYLPNSNIRYGWVDWRWLCQTNDIQSRPYEANFFCIQVDLLNPYDIKYLNPIYVPPIGSDNTLVAQRPQIINP
jgi:hypothetical protein